MSYQIDLEGIPPDQHEMTAAELIARQLAAQAPIRTGHFRQSIALDPDRKKPTGKSSKPKQWRDLIAWLETTYGADCHAEYKFHPARQWRFDFALYPETLKIAVEYQGLFGGAAHSNVGKIIGDAEKLAEAQLAGWLLFQINANNIKSDLAYAWIEEAVAIRRRLLCPSEPDRM